MAHGAIGAVALAERIATVEVVLAVVRERQAASVVVAAATSGSARSVDAAHVIHHHIGVDPVQRIVLRYNAARTDACSFNACRVLRYTYIDIVTIILRYNNTVNQRSNDVTDSRQTPKVK